jgi:hypothetical protein
VNFGLSVTSHLLQIDLKVADLTNRLPDALAKHFIETRNHCGVITPQAKERPDRGADRQGLEPALDGLDGNSHVE